MKKMYHFFSVYKEAFVHALDDMQIKYKTMPPRHMLFDLADPSDQTLARIKEFHPVITKWLEFTEKERKQANYFVMRSKNQSVATLDDEPGCNYYEYICHKAKDGTLKRHTTRQIAPAVIDREPSLKTKTCFWHNDTGWQELYTKNIVRELVAKSDLQGVRFEPVYGKSGQQKQNIFQVTSSNILPKDAIQFGHGERTIVCEDCGYTQYFLSGHYQLHIIPSKIPIKSDLYVTDFIFGEGLAHPLFIVSQAFYTFLKDNHLSFGLIFEPIVEVNL